MTQFIVVHVGKGLARRINTDTIAHYQADGDGAAILLNLQIDTKHLKVQETVEQLDVLLGLAPASLAANEITPERMAELKRYIEDRDGITNDKIAPPFTTRTLKPAYVKPRKFEPAYVESLKTTNETLLVLRAYLNAAMKRIAPFEGVEFAYTRAQLNEALLLVGELIGDDDGAARMPYREAEAALATGLSELQYLSVSTAMGHLDYAKTLLEQAAEGAGIVDATKEIEQAMAVLKEM